MITGEIKNKVDQIWTTLWTEGLTNPLTAIEQLTYLLFIKSLDEIETTKEQEAEFLGLEHASLFPKDKQYLRWHQFKQLGSPEEMYRIVSQEVFPFIKNLHGNEDTAFSKYMKDAMFQIQKPSTLAKVVDSLDNLPTSDRDTAGDIYEYVLSKLSTSGTNGQFRTPRHIIKMMVELMKPAPEDKIIDPAMGSFGFLVEASEYDYEKDFGDKPITKLVRNIVGLDRKAANEAFSEFLSEQRLNLQQAKFVELIIDYVVKNGILDKKVLQQEPFRTVGSIVEVFKDNKADAKKIISMIDEINKNAEQIIS